MFGILYEYLVRHRQLPLHGLGCIRITVVPSRMDIASKMILPPLYVFEFEQKPEVSSRHIYSWLSKRLQCSEWDAIRRLNDFAFDLKKALLSGQKVEWKGVGVMEQQLSGNIEMEAEKKQFIFEHQVSAGKILRKDSSHAVLVGDKEMTSAEMTAYYTPEEAGKTSLWPRWWAIAVVLGFLVIMFLGWHFSEKGIDVNAAGSYQKVTLKEPPASYRELQ